MITKFEISYADYCKWGALRNPRLTKEWCNRCGKHHYYAKEGSEPLYCPTGNDSVKKRRTA